MTILTNFKQYTPDCPEKRQLMEDINAVFLICDQNVDWYDSQKLFNPEYLKVVFEMSSGKIFMVTKDVTSIPTPFNLCVADVNYDTTVTIEDLKDKIFQVRTGTIVDKTYSKAELREQAIDKISKLHTQATTLITPLQYAKELDMISPEEEVYLRNLQRYVVLLSRVTSQEGYPTTIDWPILPTE